jgi:hypothetical protein
LVFAESVEEGVRGDVVKVGSELSEGRGGGGGGKGGGVGDEGSGTFEFGEVGTRVSAQLAT